MMEKKMRRRQKGVETEVRSQVSTGLVVIVSQRGVLTN